jgi:hypothetical protein
MQSEELVVVYGQIKNNPSFKLQVNTENWGDKQVLYQFG